jgi:hypothetical protein
MVIWCMVALTRVMPNSVYPFLDELIKNLSVWPVLISPHSSKQIGSWVLREKDVIDLTPQQLPESSHYRKFLPM